MTINELEQGLRNLIATQPMITTGASGEVVSSVLSMIDAFRNLSFKIQNYPCQDVLKFNMSNESQKLETTFAGLVLQILQERGINLLLYVPRSQPQVSPMVNGYGMINQPIDSNMMMGQMMYQSVPQNMGMQPQMQQPVQMMAQPNYNQMQPQMQMMSTPVQPQRQPQRRQPSTFQGYAPQTQPVKLEPAGTRVGAQRPQAAPQSKIKSTPQVSPAQTEIHKSVESEVPTQDASASPSPAEMLTAGFNADAGAGGSSSKAAGRDYLMELLKK
jgi:hypothetical protein